LQEDAQMNLQKLAQKGRGLALPLAIVGVWWLATRTDASPSPLLPAPEKVYSSLLSLLNEGKIFTNLQQSLAKVAKGFLVGIAAGFILGTLMGLSRTVEKLFGPLFNAVRQVPILGWIPLLILWFGQGELAKVIFIALGALYPMTLNTFDGCRHLKKEYLEVARVFEYSRLRLLWRFTLPAALPSILAGIRVSMSEAWLLVIGAEIFFKTRGGIGEMMWDAKERVRMDVVFITIIIIGLTGYLLNRAMTLMESRLLSWRDTDC
jgi:sulfonate transport system permease protein